MNTRRQFLIRAPLACLVGAASADGAPLRPSDDAIAFAPVTQLSRWIESRTLTSERLADIYLSRIDRWGADWRAVATSSPR